MPLARLRNDPTPRALFLGGLAHGVHQVFHNGEAVYRPIT